MTLQASTSSAGPVPAPAAAAKSSSITQPRCYVCRECKGRASFSTSQWKKRREEVAICIHCAGMSRMAQTAKRQRALRAEREAAVEAQAERQRQERKAEFEKMTAQFLDAPVVKAVDADVGSSSAGEWIDVDGPADKAERRVKPRLPKRSDEQWTEALCALRKVAPPVARMPHGALKQLLMRVEMVGVRQRRAEKAQEIAIKMAAGEEESDTSSSSSSSDRSRTIFVRKGRRCSSSDSSYSGCGYRKKYHHGYSSDDDDYGMDFGYDDDGGYGYESEDW